MGYETCQIHNLNYTPKIKPSNKLIINPSPNRKCISIHRHKPTHILTPNHNFIPNLIRNHNYKVKPNPIRTGIQPGVNYSVANMVENLSGPHTESDDLGLGMGKYTSM